MPSQGHRLCPAGDVMYFFAYYFWGTGERHARGDQGTRPIHRREPHGRMPTALRFWPGIVIATFALALTCGSARAQEEFLTFESVLSTPTEAWCIDIPQARYQAGNQLSTERCTGAARQTFRYDNTGNLTAGGVCLDGQPPAEGSPVILNQCNGSAQQVWYLVPFTDYPDVFAIQSPDGLCVTVYGDIGPATPLGLAQCQQISAQGWIFFARPAASPPVYGTYSEPRYYWYGDQRYCWYDNGWNGGGWYICDQYTVPGPGWGGPGPFPTVPPTVAPL